uniref:Charged multivesicular body protein 6 n=1 Tax=Ditylenchus dipsaci TaxID=166011 RepID=A0A915DJN5_9BILA
MEEDQAILALKMQRDDMKKAYKRYERNILKEKDMARKMLQEGRKDRALVILKRKRYQETLMDTIVGQLDQIERMVHQIEAAQLNKDVFRSLKQGNEALQILTKAFSIEDIEKIMDETREAAELQEEISSILSTKLTDDDLGKVDEEYEQMIQEQMPSVPDYQLETPEQKETSEKVKDKKEGKRERVLLPAT